MPTYFKASSRLLAAFNAANGTALTEDVVRFVDPRPAESVDPSKAVNYNTAVTLQMLPGASRTGEVVLFYNRVDLAKEFASFTSLQKDYINVSDAKSTADVLPMINAKLGLRLTVDEIEVTPITLKDDYFTTVLRALPNSMEYIGEVPVRLYNGTPAVVVDFTFEKAAAANALRYNYGGIYTTGETDFAAVVAKTDYTPIANFLMSVKAYGGYGAQNITELDMHMLNYNAQLADWLNSVDFIGWVYSTSQQTTSPNVCRFNFLFNGTTADFNSRGREQWLKVHATYRSPPDEFIASDPIIGKLADDRYERVLVVAADWPWMASKLYRSIFFFHYNVGDNNEYILRYR